MEFIICNAVYRISAGANFGEKMYTAIQTLVQNTVKGFCQIIDGIAAAGEFKDDSGTFVALGVTLATLFMCMELFSSAAGFRFQGIEDGIRIALKFVICKVVMENTDSITSAIYTAFYKDAGMSEISESLENSFRIDASGAISEGGILGMGYVVGSLILLIVWGAMFMMLVKVVAQIAGIIFEIAIHKCAAPVAMSTLCNEQARSAGISFIKSYAAVCMQGLVISICFRVYGHLNTALVEAPTAFRNNISTVIEGTVLIDAFGLIAPIVGMVVLSTAISRSSDITKRMFGV